MENPIIHKTTDYSLFKFHEQNRKAGNDCRKCQNQFCFLFFSLFDQNCRHIRHNGRKQNEYDIFDIPAHIKIIAGK